MAFTPKELKAIGFHMQQHGCIVQMSTRPSIRFLSKGEPDTHTRQLANLVGEYDEWKKGDAAEKARAKREKSRKDKLNTTYKEQYE